MIHVLDRVRTAFITAPRLQNPSASNRTNRISQAVPRDRLAVGLGHALDLVLLLDRVAVRALLRAVHDLVRQALRHGPGEPSLPGKLARFAHSHVSDASRDGRESRRLHS